MKVWHLAVTFLGSALLDLVAAGDPIVSVTKFKNVPSKIFYFEDTPVSPATHAP